MRDYSICCNNGECDYKATSKKDLNRHKKDVHVS